MTVSTGNYLKGFADSTRAMGRKRINSDFTFEIEGFEGMYLLAKQCPWPELSSGGEIEIPTPVGGAVWEAQQVKTNQQGAVAFMETVAGDVDQMLVDIIRNGGYFNGKIYEGTPQKHICYKRITDCFIQMDPVDRDWENRSQVLTFAGTMFYHYYGEVVDGNSKDYR
ncbi:hypothetical protein [Acinetobacter proteolyticus]|uniref:Uncharacterized protein n=1 Tax=Acinetobacter proteolyticus TaxID=1776741 RepID=A0A2N0WID2_9GAMM|nr:hypothetical protein [Acinetobacter proteolyticus]PKF35558.1 hypothetical protein CW311_04515 [Acinetobacter proteolyticus]